MPSKAKRKTKKRVAPAGGAVRREQPRSATRIQAAGGPIAVVGIGASAGGLEALKRFFGAMPPTAGVAFVVVVHLDPTHESMMPELLGKSTSLLVEHARDRQPLAADHVYVIPPGRTLTIEQRQIRVTNAPDRRDLRGVIDHFFRSLAEDQQDMAVAVILSGTGTEGTLGLRAVKVEGGLVIAQSPETASQPGMPSSAIATGLVDMVLSPEQMPEAVLEYVRHTRLHRTVSPAVAEPVNGLHSILAVLRARTKHDFRSYRKGTLERRIQRRMGLHHVKSMAAYLDVLRARSTEVDQLFKDLLIGVTSFFRDPRAFEELATKVFPALVKGKDADDSIRIWVPGCATGEEAYSLAIVAAEQVAAARSGCRVQIFATDVDDDALEVARAGVYPESIALDVASQRLKRFFSHADHRYSIMKSIRDSVVFATQNFLGDPPFSKLDLVSCRNVLIYLEPPVQEKVMGVFHFALNPGGYLFLGSAETTGPHEDWFAPVSRRGRIFRRIGSARRQPLEVPLPPSSVASRHRVARQALAEPTVAALAAHRLLDHFAPAAVVVRRTGEIVHFYGAMDRYITLPTGQATLDVLTLARDPLKPALRAVLQDAVRRNRRTALDTVDILPDQSGTSLRITVRPLDASMATERLWLMIFEEQPMVATSAPRAKSRATDLVRRLETQLRASKKEHHQLIEQFESSNEELKAANEEVLSMNEELQSTNEELVTSKEELQSMNEELTTLNNQLQEKVHEVIAANDDLANLLVSTDIATVFVDKDLRIKRFTTAATRLLHLMASDIGRPLNHLATTLMDIDLSGEAEAVLRSLKPRELEVKAQGDTDYIVRILPYRSSVNRSVQGIVITLSDVTALKKSAVELAAAKQQVSDDLRRMSRLHDVSTQLASPADLSSLLQEIVRAAMDITGAAMGMIQSPDETGALVIATQQGFEPSFLDFFSRVDTHTDSAYGAVLGGRDRLTIRDITTDSKLRGSPSLAVLMKAGVQALQMTPLTNPSGDLLGLFSTYYRTSAAFAEADLQWLDLLARQATLRIERRRLEDLRDRASTALEEQVADRTKWLTLLHEIGLAINDVTNWSDALNVVLYELCTSQGWQVGHVYVPSADGEQTIVVAVSYSADERFAPFQAASRDAQFVRGQRLPGRVFEDGHHVWINDPAELLRQMPRRGALAAQAGLRSAAALPVSIANDVLAVVELCSDQSHPESVELVRLMSDVSLQVARVIERERTMAQVGEIIWGEQQDLIHTLHDALGQQLTGLGMLAASLTRRLRDTDLESAETAERISGTAREALEQVRELSRGLFETDVDADSFVEALRRLASTTEALHKITCTVECDSSFAISSGRVATQLYRIVQEAITNALRHAGAEHIVIRVHAEGATATVSVRDDGVGIHHRVRNKDGIGLRIMRHRAASIGAVLIVGSGGGKGTVVTCTLAGVGLDVSQRTR